MKAKDLDYIRACVDTDGFDYAMNDYSDYKEIEDAEFHKLRLAYAQSRKALAEYLNLEE
jgi:hypothetical protein